MNLPKDNATDAGADALPPSNSSGGGGPLRCVSIDVEDYFHIEAAYTTVGPNRWRDWPARVERNVDLLLALFDRTGVTGTWFVLGDVARQHPRVPKKIADAGHEIASHGSMHDRLHRLTPGSFAQDVGRSKKLLEDLTGQPVRGYRAPTFSVTRQTAWAIDVLVEQGFTYDASIFPVTHPLYGVPDAPLTPFTVRGPGGAEVLEVPPLVWRLGSKHVAVAGGGYFRLLPLWFMKRGIRQATEQNRPIVLYFHPWEFDPDMPRMPLPLTGRIRTYKGLKAAEKRLESIMNQPGRWGAIGEHLDELRGYAAQSNPYVLK